MSDRGEDLLIALGKSIRRSEGLPEGQWEKLARGELSPEEEAALADLPRVETGDLASAAGEGHGSGEAELSLYEAVRPPDPEETRKKTEALWAKSQHAATPKLRLVSSAASNEAASKPVLAAPRKEKRSPWVILLAAALAGVMGSTGMWFALSGPDHPLLPSLPSYAVSLQGGAATMLGDPPAPDAGATAVVRLDRSMRIAMKLVPAAPVTGSLKARVWLAREGEARPWKVALRMAEDGAISIEGAAEALFRDVPDGTWDMVVVVAASEALPDEAALIPRIARGERSFGPGTTTAVQRIVLEQRHGSNAPSPGGPRIELGGCAAVYASRTCAVKPESTLRVWFGSRYAENVSLALDGRVLALAGTELQEGIAFDVPIARDFSGQTLTLVARGQTQVREEAWMLARHETPAVPSELDKLRASARAALSLQEIDEAVPLFERAIEQARSQGRASDEVGDRLALSYGQIYAGRWDAAAKTLHGIEASADPEAPAKAAFYRGLLAYEQVSLPRALVFF